MIMKDLPKQTIMIGPKGFDATSYKVIPGQVVEFINDFHQALEIDTFSDPNNKKPTTMVWGSDSFPLPKNRDGKHPKMELVMRDCPRTTYYLLAKVDAIIGEMTAHLEVVSPPNEEGAIG